VVGTSLWNYAMPLIRYRTGDYARIHRGNPTCECGRGLPLSLSKLEGRRDDIIITPGNHYIPAVNFYTLLHEIPGVKMFKIVQHSIAEVEVQVVTSDAFTGDGEIRLREGLRRRMGPEVAVEIKRVGEIKRDERTGKIRCVESKVYQSRRIGGSS
jgi:phenylacetate-CoA ligase